jgi:alkylated DNA repair protein (DNA oxidative demethylase)
MPADEHESAGQQLSLTLDAHTAAPPRAICAGATLLRGFALTHAPAVLEAVAAVVRAAPFRHMQTPGGLSMSVALSNCGALGWVSDTRGYRYVTHDPESGRTWPALPPLVRELAQRAAQIAGFSGFEPDACLVNRYVPGSRLTLHQDKDERDFTAPIVSFSLGLPATFLFGGATRAERPQRIGLEHGDVVVWGGPARRFYHGVAPLRDGLHPLTGAVRINLTLRRAG